MMYCGMRNADCARIADCARRLLFAALLLVAGPAGLGPRTAFAQYDETPSSPRAQSQVSFLQLNDVYTMQPVDGLGGLARLATEKQRLAAAGRTPFVVLAGDFLSPSVASSVFKGEQMIAALNAAGLDMATLGNHEFDFGDDVLIQRMKESTFTWVVSNVIDTRTGTPIGNAVPYYVKTFGTLKVGFIGLCLNTSEITSDKLPHTKLLDPIEAAGRYLPILKRQGAEMIVAVTHLTMGADRELAIKYPEIDLIIGGHEHYLITAFENHALISKSGADARQVARIDVARRASGTIERFYELVPMTKEIPDDAKTAAVIAGYETRLGAALDLVVGVAHEPLDAVALHIRAGETNLGNMVADAIRADAGSDVALVNGGSIRGNKIYTTGQLTRRTLIEMEPFDNVICTLSIPGRVLLDVLNHGVSALPLAGGQFPQVSGLTMTVDKSAPPGRRVRDVRVNGAPLDPVKTYTVAVPDFMLKGGDGYTMLAGQHVTVGPEAGDLLSSAIQEYVEEHYDIAPKIEGRITIR
jgi:5'-nucleotidase